MLFVLVPYRNREYHLQSLLRRTLEPLQRTEGVHVVVCEQAGGDKKFNRGRVLNAGVLHVLSRGAGVDDEVLFHDVDLEPSRNLLCAYTQMPGDVVHFGCAFERYDGDSYFGGVLRMRISTFLAVGGYPSTFWGWGGEDCALHRRVQPRPVRRPRDLGRYRDLENMSFAQKNDCLRRDGAKCDNKRELMQRDTAVSDHALANRYRVARRHFMADAGGIEHVVVDV